MTTKAAVQTLINGNVSDFKKWLKHASKAQMLEALTLYAEYEGGRYSVAINQFKWLV